MRLHLPPRVPTPAPPTPPQEPRGDRGGDAPPTASKVWRYGGKPVLAGAAGGATVAGLCTPWDRTINLASDRGLPFRRAFAEVWRTGPYRGLLQTMGGRSIQGMTNMPFYDLGKWGLDRLMGTEGGAGNSLLAGVLVGGATGAVYGAMSTPKYQTWRTHEPFVRTVARMAREGGARAFTKGIASTALRDMTFGGVFYPIKTRGMAWARESIPEGDAHAPGRRQRREMAVAVVAVTAGVLASSPFNYTRTRAFNTSPGEGDPGVLSRWRELLREVKGSSRPSRTLRNRFVMGPGTFRAVVGMVIQSRVYDGLVRLGEPP
jgi:hypothetical protein